MSKRSSRIAGPVAALLAGMVLGAALVGPAGAHFNQSTKHLGRHVWNQVIKQRVYTRTQADRRFPHQFDAGRKTVDPGSVPAGVCAGIQLEPIQRAEGAVVLVTAGHSSLPNGITLEGAWMTDTEPPHSWAGARMCNTSAGAIDPVEMAIEWQVLRG